MQPRPPRRTHRALEWTLLFLLSSLAATTGVTGVHAETEPVTEAVDPSAIDAIRVTTRRQSEELMRIPAAVAVVDADEIQLARQQLGLDESLVRVPGLFLQNRFNFSQDLRISSRGFGARSAFGIRGIKLFVDGIPATLADGQAGVDAIDLGSAARIEVMRGPASALYGAASGGVIHVITEAPPENPFAEARVSFGSDDFEKHQLKAGASAGDFGILVNASYFHLDGYREHSAARASSVNGRLTWQIADDERLAISFNATDSPWASDPGGVNRQDSREHPARARPANVSFRAGESLDQQRVGLVYEKSFGESHHLTIRNYAVWRDFSNLLPFGGGGAVELERFFGGGGVQYSYTPNAAGSLVLGIDLDAQRDDRERYDNVMGTRGSLTLKQDEDVTSLGLYGLARFALLDDLELSLGARYDQVEFEVDDDFLSDGDGSDEIEFDSFSPSASLLWDVGPSLALFATVSTSFETPTTTEFANPAGGGFNGDLEEQRATSYEVGVRGSGPLDLRFDASLFHIELDDVLVPFELASMPGRTFFRNAGEATRDGFELGASLEPCENLFVSVAYTYSDFVFGDYDTPGGAFEGNREPGIPKDQLFAELAYRNEAGLRFAWEFLWVDDFFVNDANTRRSREYLVSNLRLSQRFDLGGFEIDPFVGVNNLFDTRYDSNVRINAFGGRHYEPAPDRSFLGGVRVRYTFGS